MQTEYKSFYERPEWRALRYKILRSQICQCACCGITRDHGRVLHVDHIKPISIFPELALNESNLQVLCEDCNMGKSNKFQDRFQLQKVNKPRSSAIAKRFQSLSYEEQRYELYQVMQEKKKQLKHNAQQRQNSERGK